MRPKGKILGPINASALLGPTEGGFFNGKAFKSIAARAGRPDLQKRVDDLYATIGTAEAVARETEVAPRRIHAEPAEIDTRGNN